MTTVIEDAIILAMARNPRAVDSFPFLRQAMRVSAACCGSKPSGPDLNPVKQAIGGLAGPRLAEFKRLLGATQIRVVYKSGGSIVDRTL